MIFFRIHFQNQKKSITSKRKKNNNVEWSARFLHRNERNPFPAYRACLKRRFRAVLLNRVAFLPGCVRSPGIPRTKYYNENVWQGSLSRWHASQLSVCPRAQFRPTKNSPRVVTRVRGPFVRLLSKTFEVFVGRGVRELCLLRVKSVFWPRKTFCILLYQIAMTRILNVNNKFNFFIFK